MSMNQIVNFFKKKLAELDSNCCNISFVNGHYEEIIYNLNKQYDSEYSAIFLEILTKYFPDIDASRVDAISYQQADGSLYAEDKLMVSIDGAKKDCFLYPEIGCFAPWQHYCINKGVNSGVRTYKFYDTMTEAYKAIDWPDFIIPFDKYGAGVGIKPNIVGVYLLSKEYDKVIEFFGAKDPLPDDVKEYIFANTLIHNYGLTFNIETKELVKLSYFFYNEKMRSDIVPYLGK